MRGLFVTATDTGVGKTYLSAAIAAELRARGLRVGVAKPVLTGLDDPGPHDHELLGATPAYTFRPPVSPHLAAELAGVTIDPAALVANARDAFAGNDVVVVEGVGGLLVPLAPGYTVRDLAVELGLPLVVAARPALGTINHTRLTLEAAAGLDVRAVVLTPWPAAPGVIEEDNRRVLDAHVLAHDGDASALPVLDWLGP
ncbi:MAG: dethiobiotin synthase [Solirubrobacterales bacterium]|nr:dethiobiotin synthase [Solirubrobacterales bacterium]